MTTKAKPKHQRVERTDSLQRQLALARKAAASATVACTMRNEKIVELQMLLETSRSSFKELYQAASDFFDRIPGAVAAQFPESTEALSNAIQNAGEVLDADEEGTFVCDGCGRRKLMSDFGQQFTEGDGSPFVLCHQCVTQSQE